MNGAITIATFKKSGIKLILLSLFILTGIKQNAEAANYFSVASGNWNAPATWSNTSGGSPLSTGFPVAGDVVTIEKNFNVMVNSGVPGACATLTLNVSTTANGTSTLTLNGTTLTISGNVNVNGGTNTSRKTLITLTNTASILIIGGNLTVGNGSSASTATVTLSAATATNLKIGGSMTLGSDGTFTPGTGSTVDFDGTSAQTINTASFNFANVKVDNTSSSGAALNSIVTATDIIGNISVGSVNSGSLFSTGNFAVTLANSKTITVAANSTMNAGTSIIAFGTGATATINGTFQTANTAGFSGSTTTAIKSTNTPTISLGSNSTIEYNAAGTQAVSARTDYASLTLTGGSKTIPASTITLSNDLTINSGATYNGATNPTLNIGGDFIDNGGTFTQGTNSVTFNGTGTQNIGGTSSTITFADDIILGNASGTLSINTNVNAASVTFNQTGSTLLVSSGKTLAVTGAVTLVNSATAAVTGTIAGPGTLTAGSAQVGGTTTPTVAGTFTTTLTSTITSFSTSGNFNLVGTISTGKNNPVFNLASGTTTVGGTLTMNNNGGTTGSSSTVALNTGAQSGKLVLSGSPAFTAAATGASTTTFSGTSSVVDYNGTGVQTVILPTAGYTTLKINNTNASGATLASPTTANNLTIGDENANSIFNDGGKQLTSTGTLNLTSGTFNLGSGATATAYPGFTTNTIAPGTTVNYASSSSQNIVAVNYGNLTNSGNGTRIYATSGTIGIANGFTPSTGTNTVTSSTIDFNGTGNQTVPAFSFNNLNISGTRTSGSNVTLVNGGTINIAGVFNANTSFSGGGGFVVANNTVNFNGIVAQTIGGTGLPTFNILNINNVVAPTSLTVNSSTNAASINLPASGTTISVSSLQTLTASGAFTLNDAAGANVTGAITGAGTLSVSTLNIGNAALTFTNTFTTKLTSTIAFINTGSDLTLNGYYTSAGKLNNPTFDIQSGTLTVNGAITVVNANGSNLATFTTLIGTASAFIVLKNASPFSISGTSTIALNGNNATVDYHGSALQSVYATTYNNMQVTNASGIQLTGATIINGALGYNTGKLALNGQTLSLNGTVTGISPTNSLIADPSATLNIGGSSATSLGTLYFDVSGSGQEISNLNMNRTGGSVVFATYLTVDNVLTLTNGFITTGANYLIVQSNASTAIVAGAGNTTFTNSWVNGNLTRFYASGSTATYTFPVGDGSHGHLASIATTALTGTGVFNASFVTVHNGSNSEVSAFETSIAGNYHTAYSAMNAVGFWDIAGFTRTGGSYDIQLYTNGTSGLVDNAFGVLERGLPATSYATFKPMGGTLTANNTSGRTVAGGYALRKGLTSFGGPGNSSAEFGIGQSAAILPIQLTSFTAQKADNGTDVLLNWNTASELDNDHFEVEEATGVANSDLTFSKIGEVAGNGTSDIAHSYSFIDEQPNKSGVRYYRLKQVNTDGTYDYTNIVQVTFNASTLQSVSVYPNPVSNVLNYSFKTAIQGNVTISVININGQQVYSESTTINTGSNSIQLEMSHLAKGLYFLNLTNAEGVVSQNKIEKL